MLTPSASRPSDEPVALPSSPREWLRLLREERRKYRDGALSGMVQPSPPRGEMLLLVSIALFLVATTILAGQVGVRYILPVFPLVFIWVSRIVPKFLAARSGTAVVTALLVWHAWSSISAFPNYIPYFNEMAGGAAGGPALLDDSNIDWGQGVKQAAEYVRKRRLENVTIVFFNPFEGPGSQYYGLPRNVRDREVIEQMLIRTPTPGTYIISSHYVARLSHLNPAWKIYKPIDRIGESLLVYAF